MMASLSLLGDMNNPLVRWARILFAVLMELNAAFNSERRDIALKILISNLKLIMAVQESQMKIEDGLIELPPSLTP